ncbi:MAG: hypothetical protein GAK43_01483 [Stenotrophomonas maltophilia]|nr:MAG: hypothetical protein GAK43_01483 [Stenotrophomonas maltophilia]
MTATDRHNFDLAIALQGTAEEGLYLGQTSAAYWNMVGPFGGITAATLLQAVLKHPHCLGTPLSLTVNYASAIVEGPFQVRATALRTNRSTQHWLVLLTQADEQGEQQVTTSATVVTAARRETWGATDTPQPQVNRPVDVLPMTASPSGVAWFKQYELRPVSGAFPQQWDGSGDHSRSQLWVRDQPERALDFPALAALSDLFYPRIWLRRATPVPAGTVSITTYFHVDAEQLARVGTGYLLGDAHAQTFRNGFFDQVAHLWSEAGELIATSNQVVYYKQ